MAIRQDGIRFGHSADDYLAVVADDHRRAAVRTLAEKDRPVTLPSLARAVTAEMQDAALDAPTVAEIERTELRLHHHHLPKLEEAGVIDYDHDVHVVAPTGALEAALRAVELSG